MNTSLNADDSCLFSSTTIVPSPTRTCKYVNSLIGQLEKDGYRVTLTGEGKLRVREY